MPLNKKTKIIIQGELFFHFNRKLTGNKPSKLNRKPVLSLQNKIQLTKFGTCGFKDILKLATKLSFL